MPLPIPRRLHPLLQNLIASGSFLALLAATVPAAFSVQPPAPYRAQTLPSLRPHPPGFTRIQPQGLHFTNRLSETLALNNQILENGAGIAIGDIDGDGLPDLYFCGSENSNALFKNLGHWKFQNVTDSAGVACPRQFSTGAAFADLDGDGDLDLLVNSLGGGTRCFLNDSKGHFTELQNSGLSRSGAATSLALGDVDTDGDLDVYVTRYRTSSARNEPDLPRIQAKVSQGKVHVTPADRFTGLLRSNGEIEIVEKGEPDTLYLNQGNATFKPVSWTDGHFLHTDGSPLSQAPEEWGLSALLRDLNGDGNLDLYVCNDFFRSPDEFWIGNGKGIFRAANPVDFTSFPLSSMAIDAADINRDGIDDFFVAEMLSRDPQARHRQRANAMRMDFGAPSPPTGIAMEVMHNTLMLGRSDGSFAQIAYFSGLSATDWTWSAAFMDVDLDGWPDLLLANGNPHDVLDMDAQNELDRATAQSEKRGLQFYPPLPQKNLAYRNLGNLHFRESGGDWGFNDLGVSQAIALGDLDQDGDLDVVVGNLNESVWLYENQSSAPRTRIRLLGNSPNTAAIGATLEWRQSQQIQRSILVAAGRYLSCDDVGSTFAFTSSEPASLNIRWPSGQVQLLTNLAANTLYQIPQPTQPPTSPPTPPPKPTPWFNDSSSLIPHRHHHEPFDDFKAQPLLPQRWSELGPGITAADLNQDGYDDLIITGGRGGSTSIWTNHHGTQFIRDSSQSTHFISLSAEAMAVLPLPDGLMISHSNFDSPQATNLPGIVLQPTLGKPAQVMPQGSWGAMAAADLDGDGSLQVFVGGLPLPGQFPKATQSQILKRSPTGWIPDPIRSESLKNLGMVGGAVFADLDLDGDPDLVVSQTWGPIQIFRNENHSFQPINPTLRHHPLPNTIPGRSNSFRVGELVGLWRGIAAGDWDGDGRIDLAIGNEGLNHPRMEHIPWTLWHGDFSGSGPGHVDCFESYFDPALRQEISARGYDRLASVFPFIKESITSYRQFSITPVQTLFGERLTSPTTGRIQLNHFESCLLFNRGDSWEYKSLPQPCQFAPVFSINVADFNGDGREDLFVTQNFFGSDAESSRQDAGQSVVLQGDGTGNFQVLSALQSGVRMHGQQRGSVIADFNRDGRPDIATTQHREPTRLFLNGIAKPGMRVQLQGPRGNPHGIGASLRLRFGNRWSPRRVVTLGDGFLSCSSPQPILALPEAASELEITSATGKIIQIPIHDTQSEGFIQVRLDP